MNEMTNPFFIATCQRSGGFFLMSLLNSTEKVGYLHEYLYYLYEGWEGASPDDAEVLSQFEHFRSTALNKFPNPTGHWGTKVDIRELRIAERWLELVEVDPESIKWIWLRRSNKIRQALSHIKANTTGIWHLGAEDSLERQEVARAEIEVDIEELYTHTLRCFVADSAWEGFFKRHSIEPYTLYYEDFIEESAWNATIQGVFNFLSVPYELAMPVSTHRLRQSTGKVPKSYKNLIDSLGHILLEYTNLDTEFRYELDLETFKEGNR